ncbi:MAG: hypothetical protein P4K94_01000 [Terracidiphilus sp.]|nr:hypothetical protein [Terracidiphilus sp.]
MSTSRPDSGDTSKARANSTVQPDDGTRQLLQWGGSMVGTGALAVMLLQTLLGGFSPTGASTNTGWFALIVALMCIPFGGLLLTLGVAKWLRNRRLGRKL